MPILKSAFCGCCSLSSGTRIIGIVCAILYGLDLLSSLCGLLVVDAVIDEVLLNCSDSNHGNRINISHSMSWIYPSQLLYSEPQQMQDADVSASKSSFEDHSSSIFDNTTLTKEECEQIAAVVKTAAYSSLIVAVLCCLYMVIASGLIIYGAAKKRRSFLLPWIVGECCTVPIIGFSIIILIIFIVQMAGDVMMVFALTYCVTVVILLGIFIYLILIVISCFQEMAENQNFVFMPLDKDSPELA